MRLAVVTSVTNRPVNRSKKNASVVPRRRVPRRCASCASVLFWTIHPYRGLNIDKAVFDYGFAIDWMCKDLGFCLDAAKSLGVELPNTQFVSDRYKELQAKGHNREDTSALIKQFD